jgi:hypothetical protein
MIQSCFCTAKKDKGGWRRRHTGVDGWMLSRGERKREGEWWIDRGRIEIDWHREERRRVND